MWTDRQAQGWAQRTVGRGRAACGRGPLTRLLGGRPPWTGSGQAGKDRSPLHEGLGQEDGGGRAGALLAVAGPLPDGQHLLSRQLSLFFMADVARGHPDKLGARQDGVSHALGTLAVESPGPAWQRGHQPGRGQAR